MRMPNLNVYLNYVTTQDGGLVVMIHYLRTPGLVNLWVAFSWE